MFRNIGTEMYFSEIDSSSEILVSFGLLLSFSETISFVSFSTSVMISKEKKNKIYMYI